MQKKSNESVLNLREEFTMKSQIRFFENLNPIDSRSTVSLVWTQVDLIKAIEMTSSFELGHYGGVDTWVYLALQKYPIIDFTVGIIGSADQGYGPWYEGMVISHGGKPIVIEYNKIFYEQDAISCVSPDEIQKIIQSGFRFDALICISSIEHDGLGRYGDPLNPNKDLESMKTMKNYLKRDGLLYLSCPVGIDSVVSNWHRIYGQKRLPLLLSEWEVIDTFGFKEEHLLRDVGRGWNEVLPNGSRQFPHYPSFEPVFVLKNT